MEIPLVNSVHKLKLYSSICNDFLRDDNDYDNDDKNADNDHPPTPWGHKACGSRWLKATSL